MIDDRRTDERLKAEEERVEQEEMNDEIANMGMLEDTVQAANPQGETVVARSPTTSAALTEQEIKDQLETMGINLLEPISKKEQTMAQALEAFSSFVLDEEMEKCQAIIDKHVDLGGSSAGALQGGSEDYEIYRINISTNNEDDDDLNASAELLKEFHASRQGKRHAKVLTMIKLEQYMLGMCERRHDNQNYSSLGNLMFILAFGPTHGQVRHIDNMDPNVQICLYMSSDCASTIVYSMEGEENDDENDDGTFTPNTPITNCRELVEYWENGQPPHQVPDLLKTILLEQGVTMMSDKPYSKYFSFWDTLDANLKRFGKLYKPVSMQLSLPADPGTTLLAGGNEVHAGPPTVGPRMFAFAIGIPEQEDEKQDPKHNSNNNKKIQTSNDDEDQENGEYNNGEVQYSPVLLHVDLCCILFSIMDFESEYASLEMEKHAEAKRFLLFNVFLPFLKEYPNETYVRLLGNDRKEIRDWIGTLVEALKVNTGADDSSRVNLLMQNAIESESMFYSPDISKSNRKRWAKKTKKKRNAKK